LNSTAASITFYRDLDQLVDRYCQEQTILKYETMEVKSRLSRAEHDAFSKATSWIP
jgi:hypothetical protein